MHVLDGGFGGNVMDGSETRRRELSAEPLRSVIFDMGGVLMSFDGPAFARIFTDNEDDALLLDAALFGRGEWALLDAGAISHETMARIARAQLPERLHPNLDACLTHWPEHSEPFAATNGLARDLKARGLALYVLSNASTRIVEQLSAAPIFSLLDGWMASAFEHLMKPDPAIYELMAKRFDLNPATCLFVDDSENNCRGAEIAGMHAFHFTGDAVALAAKIDRLAAATR